ncbi:hypothetical protein ACGFYP_08215 [Streptomyces sp. NPDC048370]
MSSSGCANHARRPAVLWPAGTASARASRAWALPVAGAPVATEPEA